MPRKTTPPVPQSQKENLHSMLPPSLNFLLNLYTYMYKELDPKVLGGATHCNGGGYFFIKDYHQVIKMPARGKSPPWIDPRLVYFC